LVKANAVSEESDHELSSPETHCVMSKVS
jgi:hypothetical protein